MRGQTAFGKCSAFGTALILAVVLPHSRGQNPSSPKTANAGASGQFWAFRTLAQPAIPKVKDIGRVRSAVDRFILAKLEPKGLTFSPAADRFTLIRRAYFDLIGLPPCPDEVQAFVADKRPDAYDRLLDRLLASPHFGERWGRHWLDAAGHVDVMGTDNDAGIIRMGEGKWSYRDYVVRSFNQDKPFDRFLTEQLAGDELVDWRSAQKFTPAIKEILVATGFLRTAADDTAENELNTLDIRHGVQQRTVEVMANNLLGLTLQCAKCHDHKYEPISQEDYYRLIAIFSPAFNPHKWLQPNDRALPNVSPRQKAEMEKFNGQIDQNVAALKKRQDEVRRSCEERLFAAKLATVPMTIRNDVKKALQTPAGKRSGSQKSLTAKFEPMLKVNFQDVNAALNDKERATLSALDRQIAGLQSQRRHWDVMQVVYDVGPPSPTNLLRRGNYKKPGQVVEPGFLKVLCPGEGPFPASKPAGQSSGRRLALARWLTEPDMPAAGLVARVRVNRIWQTLFGKGIVATSENLGLSGNRPTHPELLDWLASEFIRHKWQLKPMIKLLMTSTVYRQASTRAGLPQTIDPERVDPGNRLLWRMPLRRLESEIVRDSILAVSGKLDRTMAGPPLPLETRPDGLVVVKDQGLPTATSKWRRSLYILARRNYHLSLLDVFDQPVVATSCTIRNPSAVVSQSLYMLNDAFVLEQADFFAQRVVRAADKASLEKQIESAFQIALIRRPRPEESAVCSQFLGRQAEHYRKARMSPDQAAQKALAHLCHLLLNTNEFLYVP